MARNGKRVFLAGLRLYPEKENDRANENLCCRIELQDHAGGSAREAGGAARAAAMLRLPAQAARRTRRGRSAFDLQPGGDLRRVALDSWPRPAVVSGTHRQRF